MLRVAIAITTIHIFQFNDIFVLIITLLKLLLDRQNGPKVTRDVSVIIILKPRMLGITELSYIPS